MKNTTSDGNDMKGRATEAAAAKPRIPLLNVVPRAASCIDARKLFQGLRQVLTAILLDNAAR